MERPLRNAQQQDALAAQRDRDSLHARLADDFLELKAEFPELTEFRQVPRGVVDMAVDKGISLTDAYLRHLHAQHKKTAAAKADPSRRGQSLPRFPLLRRGRHPQPRHRSHDGRGLAALIPPFSGAGGGFPPAPAPYFKMKGLSHYGDYRKHHQFPGISIQAHR